MSLGLTEGPLHASFFRMFFLCDWKAEKQCSKRRKISFNLFLFTLFANIFVIKNFENNNKKC